MKKPLTGLWQQVMKMENRHHNDQEQTLTCMMYYIMRYQSPPSDCSFLQGLGLDVRLYSIHLPVQAEHDKNKGFDKERGKNQQLQDV